MSKAIIPSMEIEWVNFFILISMLIIGMLLMWVWHKRDTKDVSAEIAGILWVMAGYLFQLVLH